MKNYEVVREVRDVLFYFLKAYADLEFDDCMTNPAEIDIRTLTYLNKVKNLFDEFGHTIDELTKHYMRAIASSINIKEDKNDNANSNKN